MNLFGSVVENNLQVRESDKWETRASMLGKNNFTTKEEGVMKLARIYFPKFSFL